MEIIPAIDIMKGKCVRLLQGDPDRCKIYSSNPLKVVEEFISSEIRRIHLVDLDASLGVSDNTGLIKQITREFPGIIQAAGGIRTIEKIEELLFAGAAKIVVSSIIVQNPALLPNLMKTFGPKMVVALDEKDEKVAIKGWQEVIEREYREYSQYLEKNGCQSIIYTSIICDGTQQGPPIEKIKALLSSINMKVIISGGIGTLEDLVALKQLDIEGVIIGTAFYEKKFSPKEALEVVNYVS
ncbi:MAG: 1-(5-phosphoribosyl)-5-[(5-phosphoribosylamino)methylideneamino]imidazole-4-carboxamide isomerase [Candidatus Heimdallarchaeota archaeon]|nr:1-(5-phosphoribosyl)-5-[(5-phosphoribosylamino)methylideneamino]imidazole-4-carboxamide isomerase [Candidatus Heimdallarchaeota archaeon]